MVQWSGKSDLDCFCSLFCLKASEFFENQLSLEVPKWRTKLSLQLDEDIKVIPPKSYPNHKQELLNMKASIKKEERIQDDRLDRWIGRELNKVSLWSDVSSVEMEKKLGKLCIVENTFESTKKLEDNLENTELGNNLENTKKLGNTLENIKKLESIENIKKLGNTKLSRKNTENMENTKKLESIENIKKLKNTSRENTSNLAKLGTENTRLTERKATVPGNPINHIIEVEVKNPNIFAEISPFNKLHILMNDLITSDTLQFVKGCNDLYLEENFILEQGEVFPFHDSSVSTLDDVLVRQNLFIDLMLNSYFIFYF